MAFEAYDYDDDGQIQDLDLYCFLKLFKEDEELFSKAFTPDIVAIARAIDEKRRAKGLKNTEVKYKLI